ncbi:MAG: hypothetical protein JO152_13795 [Mycobacteriaceae bacterium]|nr:hypothetical protein [Mycobacteriaceae bacterium]
MMLYIVYVSVIGLAIERLVSRPLPAEIGGGNPFAHVLIMAAASAAALFLLRHVRAEMTPSNGGRGVWGRATDVALGMGLSAGVGAAGRAGLHGVRNLRESVRSRRDPPPWEQIDKAAPTTQVLGEPRPGWDAILHPHASGGEQRTGVPGGVPTKHVRAADGGSDGSPNRYRDPSSASGSPLPVGPSAGDANDPSLVPSMIEPIGTAEPSNADRGARAVNEIHAGPLEEVTATTVDPITEPEPGDPPQR